jgi:hypothetical protein
LVTEVDFDFSTFAEVDDVSVINGASSEPGFGGMFLEPERSFSDGHVAKRGPSDFGFSDEPDFPEEFVDDVFVRVQNWVGAS